MTDEGMTDGDEDIDRQDIRLAVVMNGGVSLAVWIGGVAVELHHLAMARRWAEPVYRPLLDLLHADARVDVIAGTSAGGLNGAFLALGLAVSGTSRPSATCGGTRARWGRCSGTRSAAIRRRC
ncbi:hypothetical protein ACF068_10560 [Streptomyces sp. NPDC016309]|uniref:hypothetical protein n=1 Tax=Streptomyces sp. NPDC016309 TaxID=3364965 RepID=UPI0036FADDB1